MAGGDARPWFEPGSLADRFRRRLPTARRRHEAAGEPAVLLVAAENYAVDREVYGAPRLVACGLATTDTENRRIRVIAAVDVDIA